MQSSVELLAQAQRELAARQLGAAERLCRKVLARESYNPAAWYTLTAILHSQHRLEEAAQACERVIQLRPDYAAAYVNRGTMLSQMGLVTQALEMFRRAMTLAPTDAYAHSNLLHGLYFQNEL